MLEDIQKNCGIVMKRFVNVGIATGYADAKAIVIDIKAGKSCDANLVLKVVSVVVKAVALLVAGWLVVSTLSLLGSVTSLVGLTLFVAIKVVEFILLSDLIKISENIKPKSLLEQTELVVKSTLQEETSKGVEKNIFSRVSSFFSFGNKEEEETQEVKEIFTGTYIRTGVNKLIEIYKNYTAKTV